MFVIDPGQRASAQVIRIVGEQLRSALRRLTNSPRDDMEATVHSVRKNCKRVRAVVRMVRSELGSEYAPTNHAVRDASALLSPLRDAHAMLATFDKLSNARPDLFPAGEFGDVRSGLAARAQAISDPASAGDQLALATALLSDTKGRVGDWRLKFDWRDVVDGVSMYHGLARRAFRRALGDPSDDRLHEWRKRAKDGWYHTQLLRPLAPSVLGAAERTLSHLADALGDSNDLAVLSRQLREFPDELGGCQASEALLRIDGVRDDLLARCRPLGARLYAEAEDGYRARLRGYAKAYRRFGPEQRVRDLSKIFAGPAAARHWSHQVD